MSLPLAELAIEDGIRYLLTPKRCGTGTESAETALRIPTVAPGPGEQYRFHFDMTKCIGCRCCEVACNEQNNNPADVRWRRVGEIETGSYPLAERFYLSMGCNHCLQPSCLIGCPVNAYNKDSVSGLVLQSADACIGCQYCTWNCPYGVPQYNSERGVVGKCDMCYGRLSDGREPTCVNACPQGAIRVETVDVDEWLSRYEEAANAPGLPPAGHTVSTTRVTIPADLPADFEKADSHRVQPEHPHWPLVFMTVLTQLAVGAVWALSIMPATAQQKLAAVAALVIGFVSLGASTLHLGRPAYAFRALKMWRRSWLSREVLLFSGFALTAVGFASALWLGLPAAQLAGASAGLIGAAGIAASAAIYMVPARPAWNNKHTVADFYVTALLLGPLFVSVFASEIPVLRMVAIAGSIGQLLNQGLKFLWLIRSDEFELRGSARLLSTVLERVFVLRFVLLGVGGILLPALGYVYWALPIAVAGEILGRYLFFVSVVPKNMALSFAVGRAA